MLRCCGSRFGTGAEFGVRAGLAMLAQIGMQPPEISSGTATTAR